MQRTGTGQAGGQGLRAAHAAQAGAEDPASARVAAPVLARGLHEGLVGALHDALAADVDPAAGGHLAVHEEAAAVQLLELLPGGPARHEVAVGDEHARGVRVRPEHAHRLARLHQQRLVVAQLAQAGQELVEAAPVARGAADAAVDHQPVRVLRHLGIQVVLQQPPGGLGLPAAAVQLRAARRANHALGIETEVGRHGALLRAVGPPRRVRGLRARACA
jgi:hypothetical protein